MNHSNQNIISKIRSGAADEIFTGLYSKDVKEILRQRGRYLALIDRFCHLFAQNKEFAVFSTPGRTEIGGNHTDHNGGRILAATVSLDIVAVASPVASSFITVYSEGYSEFSLDLSDLTVRPEEYFTSSSLVRGVCARMEELGYRIGGFNACVSGQVPKGAGLSSSAAFEVLIVTILNHFYNNDAIDAILIAQIAQFAENKYFGKPCGLMDQTTCSVGGVVAIDFRNFDQPLVKKVECDFNNYNHQLIIVDTGGNHADLNDDYIALENEMKAVAHYYRKNVLREVDYSSFLSDIKVLRSSVNDRAILRAYHFFHDDQRVVSQVAALSSDDFDTFLDLVNQSGESSWMYCQNCYSPKHSDCQGISIALAASAEILGKKGAFRVHGGGFAGTIQAFVPLELIQPYSKMMKNIFGDESCYSIAIRNTGSLHLCFD